MPTQVYTPSTISFADLYGYRTPGQTNPNESTDTSKASGKTGGVLTLNPSYTWIAFVGMLIVVRFLWEKGK